MFTSPGDTEGTKSSDVVWLCHILITVNLSSQHQQQRHRLLIHSGPSADGCECEEISFDTGNSYTPCRHRWSFMVFCVEMHGSGWEFSLSSGEEISGNFVVDNNMFSCFPQTLFWRLWIESKTKVFIKAELCCGFSCTKDGFGTTEESWHCSVLWLFCTQQKIHLMFEEELTVWVLPELSQETNCTFTYIIIKGLGLNAVKRTT